MIPSIYDLIHMTQGELLVNYWPLWMCVCVAVCIVAWVTAK